MDRQTFGKAIKILFDIFHVPNAQRKEDAYYQFFRNEELSVLEEAFVHIAKEEERFPTPARLAEKIKFIKTALPNITKVADCAWCEGLGLVNAVLLADETTWTFRCNCSNAAKYSKNFIPWFGKLHDGFELVNRNPYSDVKQNPKKYLKGLKYLEANGVSLPNKIREKIFSAINGLMDDDVPF